MVRKQMVRAGEKTVRQESDLRKRIRNAIRAGLQSPIGWPLARLAGGLAICLMYHRIAPGDGKRIGSSPRFRPNLDLFVAEAEFERQIRFLGENYHCLSIGEAVGLLAAGRLPRGSVVITFDDGYRDNLLALPILRRYCVPATIYMITGAIDRKRTLWWDEHEAMLASLPRLQFTWRGTQFRWDLSSDERKTRAFMELNRLFKAMTPAEQDEAIELLRGEVRKAGIDRPMFSDESILTWDEIRSLDADGLITIGAHSVDHNVMSRLTDDEIRRQITGSRAELESRLGHPVEHFAYPFGGPEHAEEREFKAVAAAGFASAVTTRAGYWHRSSRGRLHALPRIPVDFNDTMEDFRWKLSGLYVVVRRPRLFASA